MKTRNSNIELLRILSMYMVLILHALNWSGALNCTNAVNYWIYWFIEGLAVVAVNVFMLISGYFQVNTTFKAKNVINIALEVWCYSVVFSLLTMTIEESKISMVEVMRMLFPITTKKFWFVNSYPLVYLLSPFLNKIVKAISLRQFNILLSILLLLFSVRTTLFPMTWSQDPTGGMSVLWLGTLYLVGAWINISKKHFIKNYLHGIIYIICAMLLVLSKYILAEVGDFPELSGKLYGYSSLIVFFESVMLFLFFLYSKPLTNRLSKIICTLAKYSFSVYIIHFSVISILYTKILNLDALYNNVILFIPWMIISNVVVFGCCVMIDMLRYRIFCKLMMSSFACRWFNKIDELMNT